MASELVRHNRPLARKDWNVDWFVTSRLDAWMPEEIVLESTRITLFGSLKLPPGSLKLPPVE